MAGVSAAAWTAPGDGARGDDLMSIGEVLAHLRPEFPDTTISKLRFLEAEGLVEPCRTPSGYRKYSWSDVARLRYVLTAQRDHYLPLRVIRDQLAGLEPGVAALSAVGADSSGTTEAADLRLRREDLLARAGLDDTDLRALEQAGLIAARNGGGYDADALEVATAAARLAEFGLQARHLRAYRAAADREIGLFGQLVGPLARQPGPAARARAAETLRELAALTQRMHAALVRAGLRETLGR
jgi:DNA-binding transcriptional MerR regulator